MSQATHWSHPALPSLDQPLTRFSITCHDFAVHSLACHGLLICPASTPLRSQPLITHLIRGFPPEVIQKAPTP